MTRGPARHARALVLLFIGLSLLLHRIDGRLGLWLSGCCCLCLLRRVYRRLVPSQPDPES